MLKVKNWPSFQHYRGRRPPWIKLHRGLLDDFDFQRLPVASRALAPMLWLLASESEDGSLPASTSELAFRLRMSEQELGEAIKPLIDGGFLEGYSDASGALAGRKQNGVSESESETETESEYSSSLRSDESPREPPEIAEAVDAWNAVAAEHGLPRVQKLTAARRSRLRARLRDSGGMEGWRAALDRLAKSSLCLGQNSRGWRADFDFLLQEKSFTKLMEGSYDDRSGRAVTSPTATALAGIHRALSG